MLKRGQPCLLSNLWQTLPSSADLGSDSGTPGRSPRQNYPSLFLGPAPAFRSSKNRDGPAFPRTRDFGLLGLPSLTQTKAGIGKTTPVLMFLALIGGLLPSSGLLPEPSWLTGILEYLKGCKARKNSFFLQFCSLSCCLCIFLYAARFPLGGWAFIHKGWEPWKPLRHLKGNSAVRSRLRVEWSSLRTQGKEQVLLVSKPPLNLARLFSRFF